MRYFIFTFKLDQCTIALMRTSASNRIRYMLYNKKKMTSWQLK